MLYKKVFLIILFFLINSGFVLAEEIDSVMWDKVKVKHLEDRYIILNTESYPDGTETTLEIREDDGIFGSQFIDTIFGEVKNNKLITLWDNADDSDRDGGGDGEYYILAKINGEQKESSIMDLKRIGSMEHGQGDCDFDSQCGNNLYCEGIPVFSAIDGGLGGDGCCYDYENWNIDGNPDFCNLAITGQVFEVTSSSQGSFNSEEFSNLNLFFVGYDDTSFLKKLITPVFVDFVKTDSSGNFNYNPEFNRENSWNANILFDWNIEVFALNENNQLIGKWTNSYSNDKSKYTRGNEYLEQIVRIHTDKPYWRDNIAADAPIGVASIQTSEETNIKRRVGGFNAVNDSQEEQIKLIRDVILKEKNNIVEGSSKELFRSSSLSDLNETNKSEEAPILEEEVLYALWEGILSVEEEGEYLFTTSIDGGFLLTLDGAVVSDSLFEFIEQEKPIYLESGEHNLSIKYVNLIEKTAPNLYWKTSGGEEFSIISSESLRREKLDFQYYLINEEGKIEPLKKFEETKDIDSFVRESSSNQFKSSALSSTPYYQISFLETPNSQIDTNNIPLLLIYGIHGESGYFDGQFENNLESKGYDVWKFYYPNDQKIVYSASLLSDSLQYVNSQYIPNKVNIVAHSMGGLVTRAYMENMASDPNNYAYDYQENVNKFVMLGTPNNGAFIANHVMSVGSLGVACDALNEILGRFVTGTPFVVVSPDEPAYEDLSIGSQFLWDLNSKNISKQKDTLILAGQQDIIPCVLFEADNSDSIVSVASASKIDDEIPLLILNKNHITLYKRLGGDIRLWDVMKTAFQPNIINIVKPLALQFLAIITDTGDVTNIIDDFIEENNYLGNLDNGEIALNSNNNFSSVLIDEGMALIKVTNFEEVNTLKIIKGNLQFSFQRNIDSNIFFHYNSNEEAIDRGLTIPSGNYDVYVNGEDTGQNVLIKGAQTTMLEINLQQIQDCVDNDFDSFFADSLVCEEGTDCNDNNNLINPEITEQCNFLDDNCNNNVDDNIICEEFFHTMKQGNELRVNFEEGSFDLRFTGTNTIQDTCNLRAINNSGNVEILTLKTGNQDKYTTMPLVLNVTLCNANNQTLEFFVEFSNNCVDNDLDSFFADSLFCEEGTDCNDNNENINPSATEQCNLLDDDCDGLIDENIPDQFSGIDVGICQQEIKSCIAGSFQVTQEEITPIEESCNLLDDNCNGLIDEIDCVDTGILSINSPSQPLFNERRIPFNISLAEKMDEITYVDNSDVRGRERTLCRRDCLDYGNDRKKLQSFSDGFHSITFKAKKTGVIIDEKTIDFRSDSKAPRISKTEPRRGFASGAFNVEFTEDNPENLILFYGNSIRNKTLDIENECILDRSQYNCETKVNLSDFNGGKIKYWFSLTDIAGNSDISRETTLEVDTTNPILNSFNYSINRRMLNFVFNITEENFEEINYIDSSDSNLRVKKLCSRLRNGICEVRKSFNLGEHSLTINILDKAGNSIQREISFIV